MKKSLLIIVALLSLLGSGSATPQAPLRVAVIGLSGPPTTDEQPQAALQAALARSAQITLIDPEQIQPAVAGVGYDGSINLTRDEARRLGAAIGCDFFIIGKRDLFTRSEARAESHEEALAGVMIVDARTGELTAFDFINERAATRSAAIEALTKTMAARADGYINRILSHRARRDATHNLDQPTERVEEMPTAESAAGAGFKPPEFLNRVKPEYTAEAERADITATVEASAVFRTDGTVGEITITRWAGFGLDEAAARAIHQLKFKPATRNGQPVSVRATVRYNFRRLSEPGEHHGDGATRRWGAWR